MPRTVTITKDVYSFDELTEEGKERARDWYRECIDLNDYDTVKEDFQQIAEIIGIDFKTHQVQLMSGKTRQEPNIWWSGFCSQGDGACFEGSYSYAPDAIDKLRAEYNDDQTWEPLRIASELAAIQCGRIMLGLTMLHATIEHTSTHYYHEHTCSIEVHDDSDDDVEAKPEQYEQVRELMRDLMRWLYEQLDAENDYLNSDEYIDDTIRANDYEFTELGECA